MIAAFLLGLTGSVGHCVGMCSGVALLLSRRGAVQGWRVLLLHLGRITTYGALGAIAGGIGYSIVAAASYCSAALIPSGSTSHAGGTMPVLGQLQGVLALVTAVLSLYMALSLLGLLPSPELLFMGLTKRWGQWMRRLTVQKPGFSKKPGFLSLYTSGMLWGLLPCGLVMTGLVAAAVTGSPWRGALTMFAFGVGTWPVTVGISVLARLRRQDARRLALPQLRYAAALVVLAFGTQMALRGLAAWGWITHYRLGEVVLW